MTKYTLERINDETLLITTEYGTKYHIVEHGDCNHVIIDHPVYPRIVGEFRCSIEDMLKIWFEGGSNEVGRFKGTKYIL